MGDFQSVPLLLLSSPLLALTYPIIGISSYIKRSERCEQIRNIIIRSNFYPVVFAANFILSYFFVPSFIHLPAPTADDQPASRRRTQWTICSTQPENWRGISDEWLRFSRASVALQLAVGIDLDAALEAPWEARRLILPRVQRALRREHLRGVARHWSYDLNRHIALKQALAYLSDKTAVSEKKTAALSAAVFAD